MTYTIAIAGFQHETNTFAPQKATLDKFIEGEGWPPLTEGKAIFDVFEPMNIPIGGFITSAKAKGWTLEPIVWAAAQPSSYVTDEAFEHVAKKITDGIAALKGRIDAVYLDLHGAMVTESFEDGEGELLRRVRAVVGPDLPIMASLDLHANVTDAMVRHSDLLVAYRTYPHLDMAVTGGRVARQLEKRLSGERPKQAKALRRVPFLIPLTAQCTFLEPCKSIYDTLADMERGAVSSLSFSPGFHPADIAECGPTIVAYADTQEAADKAADDLTLSHVMPASVAEQGRSILLGFRGPRGCQVSLWIGEALPDFAAVPVRQQIDGLSAYVWRVEHKGYALMTRDMDAQRFVTLASAVARITRERFQVDDLTRMALQQSADPALPCPV